MARERSVSHLARTRSGQSAIASFAQSYSPASSFFHTAVGSFHGITLWSGAALLSRTAFVPTPLLRLPSYTLHSIVAFIGLGLGIIALVRLVGAIRNRPA